METSFLNAVKGDWEAAVEEELLPRTKKYYQVRLDDKDDKLVDHWHWKEVLEDTLTKLYNATARKRLFGIAKAIEYRNKKLRFGSRAWKRAIFIILTDEFPIGDLNDKAPFWVSLGRVPDDAYERYSDETIPVFSEKSNELLVRKRDDREGWMRSFKIFYREYFERLSKIYLIVDPNDETQPKYQLKKSLAIDADQRVFLVENVKDKSRMVVKWEDEISSSLDAWSAVKDAGVPMMEFKTNYTLGFEDNVLLMEYLTPIDASDDIYNLLLDIIPQLQALHRAGFVHADLKLDNMMKRVRGEKIEYFVIDYDSISRFPIAGIRNAVDRISYSPFWTSQVRGDGSHPTSYRYDLEELFYAIVDLAKQQFGLTRDVSRLHDDYVEARVLVQRKIDRRIISRFTHQTRVLNDNYLTALFPMIMDLPERLPFDQIDHSSLVEFIRQKVKMQSETVQSRHTCAICENSTINTIHTVDEENNAVVVCGIRCAALANEKLHKKEALEYRNITRCHRKPIGCVQCGKSPQFRCGSCRIPYCSTICQKVHWEKHKKICK
jgi:hypothetical protein